MIAVVLDDGVEDLVAEEIPRAMQGRLLLLDRYEPHARPVHGFANSFCVVRQMTARANPGIR